jgi:hypothetical protein
MTDLEALLTRAKESPRADYYRTKIIEKAGFSPSDGWSYFEAVYVEDGIFAVDDINALLWLQKEIDLESK